MTDRSFDSWRAALEQHGVRFSARPKNGRWRGSPCPACRGGSKDRLWLEDSDAVLVGCNQGCSFDDIRRAVFPDQNPLRRRKTRRPKRLRRTPRKDSDDMKKRIKAAGRIWAEALPGRARKGPGKKTAPARWARRRKLWDPSASFPAAVRYEPGPGKAGTLVVALRPLSWWTETRGEDDEPPPGVQRVFIDRKGRKRRVRVRGQVADKLSKGRCTGCAVIAGPGEERWGGTLHVAEGLADAMAIAARYGKAVFVGGKGGFRRLASEARTLARHWDSFAVWPDRDEKGDQAAESAEEARVLADALAGVGMDASVVDVPAGEDPASWLAQGPAPWEGPVEATLTEPAQTDMEPAPVTAKPKKRTSVTAKAAPHRFGRKPATGQDDYDVTRFTWDDLADLNDWLKERAGAGC